VEPGELDALALDHGPASVLRPTVERDSPLAVRGDLPLADQNRMAGWCTVPVIMLGTRTSWTPLPGARAFKLKGVGYREAGGTPRPPADVSFHRSNPHLGVRDDGELTIIPSSPSPLGGMLLGRALTEFDVAAALAEASVPAVLPVRVFRYEGISYTAGGTHFPMPMGAVLTLAPAAHPHRADLLVRAPEVLMADEQELLEGLLGPPGGAHEARRRIELIATLAKTYGAALRGFALAGFFRHSGSLDNWALAASCNEIYLTDLDSARSLADFNPVRAPLEVIRDVAGALFNIAAALMHPDVALRIEPSGLERIDPFGAFLRGYHEEIPRSMLIASSRRFRRHWMPLLTEQRRRLVARARGEPFKRVWMNRRASSGLAFAVAYDLYANSDLRQVYGLPCSRTDLYERIARFLAGTGDPPPK
jgi:hypothetical protein